MTEIEIPERSVLRPPRPKWRRRLLLGALILVFLALAVAYFFLSSIDKELLEAIAEADRLDPGWRIPELQARRAMITEEQNSALVLLAAENLLPANWPFWDFPQAAENQNASKQGFQISRNSLWSLEPPVQLDQRQTRALREELRRAEEALATVRKVVNLPKGRYPKQNWLNTLRMGRLPAYDALLRAQDQDLDGALTSCRGILNCGRSIGDEPGLMPMLVRVALNRVAAQKVERVLAQGELSEIALSSIQRDLEEEAKQPLLLIATRGERGGMDELMQAIQDGDLDPKSLWPSRSGWEQSRLLRIRGMAKYIRGTLLKRNNQFVEIAKLPVEQQVGRINELEAAKQDLPSLTRIFVAPMFPRVTSDFHADCAQFRCAAVMVAVERYRHANNRWPDALTDLVPAYLSKVPLDSFGGAPLRYRRLSDGVVIYSVGPDGKDNGGKLDNSTKQGTDFGFRLWDVPQRRQPPKPPTHRP